MERYKVMLYLDRLGLKHSTKGFGYLMDAVILGTQRKERGRGSLDLLLSDVAKLHNASVDNVYQTMRNALKSATNIHVSHQVCKRPGEFIEYACDYLNAIEEKNHDT